MKITQNEALKGVAKVLEDFAEMGDLTAQQLRTFLLIARQGRITGQDIIKDLGISKANASRSLAVLSDDVMPGRKAPTLGLITYERNINDKRYRYVVLTEKGKALIRNWPTYF